MELPSTIQQWVDETLNLVQAHPEHELGGLRRRDFYHLFASDEQEWRFLTWLDIVTARHVLPIYEAGCPEAMSKYDIAPDQLEDFLTTNVKASETTYQREISSYPYQQLARRMIENAEALLAGTVQHDFLVKLVNDYYHTAFNPFDWLFEDDDIFTPDYILSALQAAYAATKTAIGYYPLDHLERFTQVGTVTITPEGDTTHTSNPVRADRMSDDELGGSPASDCAASAMIAYASANQGGDLDEAYDPPIDYARKLAFWEWWLTEAIPQAWEKANG